MMNEFTGQFLEGLWEGNPDFGVLAQRVKDECKTMTAAEAAVIGRDLLLRRDALYTRAFATAAFLASDGMAGNDGFMDFADCVAMLPEERYQTILEDHDRLVDDPVSQGFGEFHMISEICGVFDRHLLGDEEHEHFLDGLVFGFEDHESPDLDIMGVEETKSAFPMLFAKCGDQLKPRRSLGEEPRSDRATLDDLIGG